MKQRERAAAALAMAIEALRAGCMKLDECNLELRDLPQTSRIREMRLQIGRTSDYVDRSTRTMLSKLSQTGLIETLDEEILDRL